MCGIRFNDITTAMRGLNPAIGRPTLRLYNCQSCTRFLRMRRRFATTAPEIPEIFDVVCVGGGPAGLSLLTALRMTPTES
jgi:hypothetical protein